MSLRVRVEKAAAHELSAAIDWYDAQRPGLGDDLLDQVHAAVHGVAESPAVGLPVPGCPPELGVRRVLVRRFPYAIVYRVAGEELQIVAFAHSKRKPGYWRDR